MGDSVRGILSYLQQTHRETDKTMAIGEIAGLPKNSNTVMPIIKQLSKCIYNAPINQYVISNRRFRTRVSSVCEPSY